jgi:ribonuclease J
MQPSHKDFWFVPLGGCGEIGMNLNLYGHAGRWLMVDCGVTFEKYPEASRTGNRVEMPDPTFISNRAESLEALIATHAHEDHIGAIAHLWEQFRCPIYTTPFTRNVVLRKLRDKGLNAPIITVLEGEEISLGPFRVKWLPITHSTPETNALLITTAVGNVLHTADWKLDSAPIAGQAINPQLYRSLGQTGIDVVVCDSTNATVAGHSVSESELFNGLNKIIGESTQRVVVGCFSSNVARMQTLGNVSRVSGRFLGLLGRSIQRMVSSAQAAGYLRENFNLVDNFDLGYMQPEEVLLVATGSQGEPGAALHRLAADSHPDVNLSAGDHVIFSTKTIPGNEEQVARLVNAFRARGIKVTLADESDIPLHASGHPCEEELRQMYQWTKPRLAIPVHGEAKHMRANASLAGEAGVPHQLVGQNGDLFDLVASRIDKGEVVTGRLWYDEGSRKLVPVR